MKSTCFPVDSSAHLTTSISKPHSESNKVSQKDLAIKSENESQEAAQISRHVRFRSISQRSEFRKWSRGSDSLQTASTVQSPRLLFADDSHTISRVIVNNFQSNGYEVVHVTSGLMVLERLASESTPFDIVMIDEHLPGDGGIETIAKIRDLEERSKPEEYHPHLIFGCSCNKDEATKNNFLDAGADQFLSKPFTIQQFYLFALKSGLVLPTPNESVKYSRHKQLERERSLIS